MARKRFTAEQIIMKRREAEVWLQGKPPEPRPASASPESATAPLMESGGSPNSTDD